MTDPKWIEEIRERYSLSDPFAAAMAMIEGCCDQQGQRDAMRKLIAHSRELRSAMSMLIDLVSDGHSPHFMDEYWALLNRDTPPEVKP